jgi:hypothetical protein
MEWEDEGMEAVEVKQAGANTTVRDRMAAGLMGLAAVAALYAFVSGVGVALTAGPATQQVEWWRVMGFLLFTGLFILLAIGPRRYPGLWELVLIDKAVLTLIEVWLISGNAENAFATAVVDGILTCVILAAYLLSRGYRAWKRN